MKRAAVLVCLIALLAGCARDKVLQATGGSRADGVVELAFETGGFERPVIDWEQAQGQALKRCTAWGYSSAEKFGGVKTQCNSYYQGTCVAQTVTVPYQCINT